MPLLKLLAVYILECADGSFYVGVTNNPDRRLSEHENGIDSSSYTYKRRPVKLVHIEYFQSARKAITREKQIKGWTRAKKTALIQGNIEALKELAKCRSENH